LTGNGGELSGIAAVSVKVPSDNTARIQESHILIAHIVCEIIENAL
ncbi:MAG: phosphoheptose isomerase, partial [Candidatus Omnitrophica bacterium]|nr:phosphoheptose isomerase [Candidatus Omnitrophota bacterium]